MNRDASPIATADEAKAGRVIAVAIAIVAVPSRHEASSIDRRAPNSSATKPHVRTRRALTAHALTAHALMAHALMAHVTAAHALTARATAARVTMARATAALVVMPRAMSVPARPGCATKRP